jgi:hypothetical protein
MAAAIGGLGGLIGVAQAQPTQPSPLTSPSAPSAPSAPPGRDDPRQLFGLEQRPIIETSCAEAPDPSDVLGSFPELRDECALSQDPFDEHSPLVLGTWLEASRLLRLPGADSTHDSQASFALGAGRDDGGVFIGGASSLENRWTIEGAPADSIRLGGAETRIPLPFLAGVRVSTGGFSARDRTSSGGVIDAELLRGGDRHVISAYGWAGMQSERRDRPVLPGTFAVVQGRLADPSFVAATVVAAGAEGERGLAVVGGVGARQAEQARGFEPGTPSAWRRAQPTSASSRPASAWSIAIATATSTSTSIPAAASSPSRSPAIPTMPPPASRR